MQGVGIRRGADVRGGAKREEGSSGGHTKEPAFTT